MNQVKLQSFPPAASSRGFTSLAAMGAAAAGLVLALCVTLATAAGVPRPTVLLLDGGSKRAAAVLSLRRAAAQLQAALGDGREVCAPRNAAT